MLSHDARRSQPSRPTDEKHPATNTNDGAETGILRYHSVFSAPSAGGSHVLEISRTSQSISDRNDAGSGGSWSGSRSEPSRLFAAERGVCSGKGRSAAGSRPAEECSPPSLRAEAHRPRETADPPSIQPVATFAKNVEGSTANVHSLGDYGDIGRERTASLTLRVTRHAILRAEGEGYFPTGGRLSIAVYSILTTYFRYGAMSCVRIL